MDQMVQYYTSKKATKGRPIILWYNIMNVSPPNTYIIFAQIKQGDSKRKVNHARQLFFKELANSL